MGGIIKAIYSITPFTGGREGVFLSQQTASHLSSVVSYQHEILPLVSNCHSTLPAVMLSVQHLVKPFTIRDGTPRVWKKCIEVLMKGITMDVKDSVWKTAKVNGCNRGEHE
jgi:hypothetical protein